MTRWLTISALEMKAIQAGDKKHLSTSNHFNVEAGDNIQLECYEASDSLPLGNSLLIYVNKVLRSPSFNFSTSLTIYFNIP